MSHISGYETDILRLTLLFYDEHDVLIIHIRVITETQGRSEGGVMGDAAPLQDLNKPTIRKIRSGHSAIQFLIQSL